MAVHSLRMSPVARLKPDPTPEQVYNDYQEGIASLKGQDLCELHEDLDSG